MQYRQLGRTGLMVSELGMGLEHLLPKDEKTVTKTLRAAIEGGVNYLDCISLLELPDDVTVNEDYVKLGKALKGYRDQVRITFLGYATRTVEYARADFARYLAALETDHTDVFIVACCDKPVEYEAATGSGSLLEYAKQLQSEGKVKYIGFSTHDTAIAHRAINSGAFDVLMYPINPAFDVLEEDGEDVLGSIWDAAKAYTSEGASGAQPRKSVYAACARANVGLVAMKPFGGGFILGMGKDAGLTPLNLTAYALAQEGVSTVVPGCADAKEIKALLRYYTCRPKELDYSSAVAKSRWSIKGKCLYCGHCLPCPQGIDIPQVNRLLDGNAAGDGRTACELAAACVKCGQCAKRCPFGVDVVGRMEQAGSVFVVD